MRQQGDGLRKRYWLTIAVLMVVLAACSTPQNRHVRGVDSSEDTIQFLFEQELEHGAVGSGVIECDVADEGLENCRRIDVEYR